MGPQLTMSCVWNFGIPIVNQSAFQTMCNALTTRILLSALQKQLLRTLQAVLAIYLLCLFRQNTGPCHNAWSSDSQLLQQLLQEDEVCLDQSEPVPTKAIWPPPAAGNKSFPCCNSTHTCVYAIMFYIHCAFAPATWGPLAQC